MLAFRPSCYEVVAIGQHTTPKGQTQPQQQQTPQGNSRPIYCDPAIMNAMQAAWNLQNPKNMIKANSSEAGFPTYKNANGYQAGNGPANKPPEIQEGDPSGFQIKMRSSATDIFHTHPRGDLGLPSPASNHAVERTGDTVQAIQSKRDIYVISDNGLSRAPVNGPPDPKYGKKGEDLQSDGTRFPSKERTHYRP